MFISMALSVDILCVSEEVFASLVTYISCGKVALSSACTAIR